MHPRTRLVAGAASARVLTAGFLIAALVLGAAWWLRPGPTPSPPRIELAPALHDLGEMAIDGEAEFVVEVRNVGGSTLEIASIMSSCGCTSAELDLAQVPPGGAARLTVRVDHDLMPTEGEFRHVVFLATNDPEVGEAEVEVRGVGVAAGAPHAAAGAPHAPAPPATAGARVEVFYNDACSDCLMYIHDTLLPALERQGYGDVATFDYLKERAHRTELNRRNQAQGIPFELQSHLMTFVGDELVLAGHIPTDMIHGAFAGTPPGARLLVFQDKMPEMGQRVLDYRVWDFRGDAVRFPIEAPLSAGLASLDLRPPVAGGAEGAAPWGVGRLVPLVVVSGLLDGVNPCAIAVLLLSMAVLFTLQRTRRQVLLTGGVYVGAIFLAYLGIGLGLFGAIVITGEQHLAARVGSWLLVVLGLVNVKDYFWYGVGPTLSVPKVSRATIKGWLERSTLPATAVAGFLVGLCTFPCTGGIYVAILGLLSAQTTYAQGLAYLVLYNLMFILPLVVLLFALGNRRAVGALSRWQAENKRMMKLSTGAVMVAMGAVILLWFV